MATGMMNALPKLDPDKYESWKKAMSIWQVATNVPAKKQAPTVFLSLTGKASEAVLEMDVSELNADDGMTKLYAKLDSLFAMDKDQAALNAYERFEQYIRPTEVSMADYKVEFDRMVEQLKNHKIELPEPVLAYRALRSANLSSENEKLVRATVPEVKLSAMMSQLTKIAGMKSRDVEKSRQSAILVKQEVDLAYSVGEAAQEDKFDEPNDIHYNYSARGRYPGFRGNNNPRRQGSGHLRGKQNIRGGPRGRKRLNPPGSDGKPSKCHVCGSTMHWARNCPHSDESGSYYSDNQSSPNDSVFDTNLVLLNLSDSSDEKCSLLGQTVGSAILDSGCAKSVCGSDWYHCYTDTLPVELTNQLKPVVSNSVFRFGNGSEIKSKFQVALPCQLAGKNIKIMTDVIDSEIPLLISKKAMKKAKCVLDFKNDKVEILGTKIDLYCTNSGHYYVPLVRPLEKVQCSEILFVRSLKQKSYEEKVQIARKLHRQFSHPSFERLSTLVKRCGQRDKGFIKIIEEVTENCDICNRYKKPKSRPVVGFPLAQEFNEVVAMDIKEIAGKMVLHLVDHATRYSVASLLKCKRSDEIVKVVMQFWVAYFGAPKILLTDNGREFNNEEFREMAQNLNIIVKTTPAQSPWSNGVNERHNAVLGEMVTKVLEENSCSMEVALGWCVSAKNTLHSVHGYSSNQLVFGRNPNVPSVLVDSLPALEAVTSSQVVASHLNALHSARKAFIESESSERLRRALRHQVREFVGGEYQNGDLVYYKRNESNRWMGPGSVIGFEGKQVLVKHGGSYVRVHSYRLQMLNNVPSNRESRNTLAEEKSAVSAGQPGQVETE